MALLRILIPCLILFVAAPAQAGFDVARTNEHVRDMVGIPDACRPQSLPGCRDMGPALIGDPGTDLLPGCGAWTPEACAAGVANLLLHGIVTCNDRPAAECPEAALEAAAEEASEAARCRPDDAGACRDVFTAHTGGCWFTSPGRCVDFVGAPVLERCDVLDDRPGCMARVDGVVDACRPARLPAGCFQAIMGLV